MNYYFNTLVTMVDGTTKTIDIEKREAKKDNNGLFNAITSRYVDRSRVKRITVTLPNLKEGGSFKELTYDKIIEGAIRDDKYVSIVYTKNSKSYTIKSKFIKVEGMIPYYLLVKDNGLKSEFVFDSIYSITILD